MVRGHQLLQSVILLRHGLENYTTCASFVICD